MDVQIDDPNNIYGQVTAPEVTVGGGMGLQARSSTKAMVGVRFDEDLGCLTLVPTDTAADTLLSGATATGGTWKEIVSPNTQKQVVCQLAAPSGEYSYETAGDDTTPLVGDGQGIWLDLGRSGNVDGATDMYARATFHNADDSMRYRIVWAIGEMPRVEKSEDSGTTWVRVGDIPVNDGGAIKSGRPAVLRLQIMRANGYVAFRSAASNAIAESACVIDDFEPVIPFTVAGKGCNLSIAWRPVTFEASGTFTSQIFQKTFDNSQTPEGLAEGRPMVEIDRSITGVTLDPIDTGSDWTAQFILGLEAQDSGLTTPCVWSAGLRFPADTVEPGTPAWVSLGSVTGYELQAVFVPQGLTIVRAGRVYGNNRYSEFGTAYGMRAVRVFMNVGVLNESAGVITWFGPSLRFVGWLNLDSVTTETGWNAALTERGEFELGVPMLDDVILDGDCIYHAVKVLCQRGGFTRGWFADGVPGNPSDAWNCDGITCNPALGHIRLGRGFDQNPLWLMEAGIPIRQHIASLQTGATGYNFYFGIGNDGKVYFHPWDFTGVRAAWDPAQVFRYVGTFSAGVPNLDEMTGAIVRKVDLSQVRNSVTLVGLDKDTWEPLVSHALDMASIATSSYPATPINYMGRVRPYFESDSRYATAAIADAVAARKFALFREPIESYDPLEVIPQPLNPLQYIGVTATFTMPKDEKFYIGSVRETIQVVDGPTGAARVDGTMMLTAIVVPDV